MKKLISILLFSLSMTSCIGYHHRGHFGIFDFFVALLILALLVWAFNRVSRNPDRQYRRRNLQVLLIVVGLLLLWPILGFILIPLFAVSMGIFFFFPPLLLLILVIVLLMSRRR